MYKSNGLGEANFLGGVARAKGVKGFDPEAAKKRFFEIYLAKVLTDDHSTLLESDILDNYFGSCIKKLIFFLSHCSMRSRRQELDFLELLSSSRRYIVHEFDSRRPFIIFF